MNGNVMRKSEQVLIQESTPLFHVEKNIAGSTISVKAGCGCRSELMGLHTNGHRILDSAVARYGSFHFQVRSELRA